MTTKDTFKSDGFFAYASVDKAFIAGCVKKGEVYFYAKDVTIFFAETEEELRDLVSKSEFKLSN